MFVCFSSNIMNTHRREFPPFHRFLSHEMAENNRENEKLSQNFHFNFTVRLQTRWNKNEVNCRISGQLKKLCTWSESGCWGTLLFLRRKVLGERVSKGLGTLILIAYVRNVWILWTFNILYNCLCRVAARRERRMWSA